MSAVRKTKATASHLRVIKGGKTNPLNNIVESTWAFIHAALWNHEEFSESEKMQFQNLIADHYNTNKHPEKVFEEILRRIYESIHTKLNLRTGEDLWKTRFIPLILSAAKDLAVPQQQLVDQVLSQLRDMAKTERADKFTAITRLKAKETLAFALKQT